jgi:hypothetical protein
MVEQERDDPVDWLRLDEVVVVEDDGRLLMGNGGKLVDQRARQRLGPRWLRRT